MFHERNCTSQLENFILSIKIIYNLDIYIKNIFIYKKIIYKTPILSLDTSENFAQTSSGPGNVLQLTLVYYSVASSLTH